jgi:ATP-dependent Clp protease protease subunit
MLNCREAITLRPLLTTYILRLFTFSLILAGMALAEEAAVTDSVAEVDAAAMDSELELLQGRLARLMAENQIYEAELKNRLRDLHSQRQQIEAELGLKKQELAREFADLQNTQQRLELENGITKARQVSELAVLRLASEKDNLELTVIRNANQRAQLELQQKQLVMQSEMLEMQLREKRRQDAQATLHDTLGRLEAKLEVIAKRRALHDIVTSDVAMLAEPFQNGVLTVSDRRIALNGPIISGTADHITRRIHYFNNQSDAPIFLIIDDCPGGSTMQGYRILKAIEASQAPVHVVVKSFAASMAAVITTDAEYSYAYPNAIILHHQPWGWSVGNVSETKEWAENMKEWARRLHRKTAERMGLDLDAFYARMYKETVTGDWEEFADEAVKLKWVGNIVHLIREDGINQKPTDEAPQLIWARSGGAAAPGTEPSGPIILPRLGPYDFYFLYNGDQRYKWGE